MNLKKRVKFGSCERKKASRTGTKSKYCKALPMGRHRSEDEMGRFVNSKKEDGYGMLLTMTRVKY